MQRGTGLHILGLYNYFSYSTMHTIYAYMTSEILLGNYAIKKFKCAWYITEISEIIFSGNAYYGRYGGTSRVRWQPFLGNPAPTGHVPWSITLFSRLFVGKYTNVYRLVYMLKFRQVSTIHVEGGQNTILKHMVTRQLNTVERVWIFSCIA